MSGFPPDIDAGARNLLINCAELSSESSVLIICESGDLGYYDEEIVDAVARVAQDLCARVEVLSVSFNPVVTDPGKRLTAKMAQFDRVVFFARLGDQLRFRPSMKGAFSIMSYALDGNMLSSCFGQANYQFFVELKNLVNNAFSYAKEIHVTCPEGTDFRGPGVDFPGVIGETTVKRFPISVFSPIPPLGFSGKIAQVGFLAGTGSQTYEPSACEIEDKIFVHFEGDKITRFEGSTRDVKAVEKHYDFVSELFGLERNHIHSWHAGIHPGCDYVKKANANFDRWSNGAFGNPRVLHFHTCGTHAPGEISLNVIDPTVRIDGVPIWERGRLHPERIAGGQGLLDSDPQLANEFAFPATNVGLADTGKLKF